MTSKRVGTTRRQRDLLAAEALDEQARADERLLVEELRRAKLRRERRRYDEERGLESTLLTQLGIGDGAP